MADELEDIQETDEDEQCQAAMMLAVLDELRANELTEEEKRVLNDFDRFRQQHPIDLRSRTDIDIES